MVLHNFIRAHDHNDIPCSPSARGTYGGSEGGHYDGVADVASYLDSNEMKELPSGDSPPISPRDSDEMKLYRSLLRGKTMERWLKDQKERKKQEIRTHNAQLHVAVSMAGVAAAVAALAASNASSDMSAGHLKMPSKIFTTIASAAALVASHCIEIVEEMGVDHNHISTTVNFAI
nr:hypothetical protein CFP56_70843 [Quercus suber]